MSLYSNRGREEALDLQKQVKTCVKIVKTDIFYKIFRDGNIVTPEHKNEIL